MTPRLPNGARLTPGRVRSITFRLARLGHRGLDEDDVRDFCDQVEQELSQLLQERNGLQREVHRLRGWARTRNQSGSHARNRAGTAPALPLGAPTAAEAWAPGGVDARVAGPAETRAAGIAGVPALAGGSGHSLTPPHGTGVVSPRCRHQDAHGQAVSILAKAQQTADQYVSNAHAYSRTVAHDAQRRREKILAEAHAQATVMLEQAHHAAVRAGFTVDQGPSRPRGGLPPDQSSSRLRAGLAAPGPDPGRTAAAVPARPAPVPEPRKPAPARAPDPTPSDEPAIYNAVVARYPHVAPIRRELRASPASGDSRTSEPSPAYHPAPVDNVSSHQGATSGTDPRARSGAQGQAGTGAHRAGQSRPDAHPDRRRYASPTTYSGPPAYPPATTNPPAPANRPPAAYPQPAAHPQPPAYPQPTRYSEPTAYPDPPGHNSPAIDDRNPGYNLPAPPPDYSTVIDYPGPAADYHGLGPVHHEPGRERHRRNSAWFSRDSSDDIDREARRYLDQYRDPGADDARFPF